MVITAGIARKPGMTRDDLLNTNAGIVKSVSEHVKKTSPNAIVIVVSNPLDVMCYVAKHVTGFPRERVIGMAGVLDTARYRSFLAEALDVSVRDIQAMVLGGHGDTMVPLDLVYDGGRNPVTQLMGAEQLDAIVQRARDGGAEIVKHLKTGSAYYAPSAAPWRWSMPSCTIASASCRVPHGSRVSTACRDCSSACPASSDATASRRSSRSSSPTSERAALEKSCAGRSRTDVASCPSDMLDRRGPRASAPALPHPAHVGLTRFWRSTIGKKVVMAVTGIIGILFVIGHMTGNLLMFKGAGRDARVCAAAAHQHAAAVRVRAVLAVARRAARRRRVPAHDALRAPLGRRLRQRKPQVTTFAARTIKVGRRVILLVFIVYHILAHDARRGASGFHAS